MAAARIPRQSPFTLGGLIGVAASLAVLAGPARAQQAGALAATRYVDHQHPSIRREAQQLTGHLTGDRAKAIAIHDFVRDRIVFGFEGAFHDLTASEVLSAGRGYCNNQGTLFVALLRAAGIPSRQRFFALSSKVLEGVIDPGTAWVDHAVSEVHLDGRWVAVDSYIVDAPLADAVRRRLDEPLGLGMRRDASREWDGASDSFSQFHPDFVREEHGVFDDVGAFYAEAARPDNRLGPLERVLFRFAARSANAKLDRLRTGS